MSKLNIKQGDNTYSIPLYDIVPTGTILSGLYKNAPTGYLLCDGAEVNISDYQNLYNVIGSLAICKSSISGKFKLPDMREVVLVGVGQNENLSIAAHDVYTLGEFKDDQLQGHEHYVYKNYESESTGGAGNTTTYGGVVSTFDIISDNTNGTPRVGTTTHGKQFGVNYIIKY